MKTEEELCDFLGKDLNKIEKLCRICLSDDLSNAVLIRKDSEKDLDDIEILEAKLNMDVKLSLWEKIAVFGRINVKYEDDLLKYICEQCCYDVDVACTFRVKCHKAQNLLLKVVQTMAEEQSGSISQIREGKIEFIEMPAMDEASVNKLIIKKEFTDYTSDQFDEDCVNEDYLENFNKKKYKTKQQPMRDISSCKNKDKKEGTSEEYMDEIENSICGKSESDEEKKYKCNVCHKAWATNTSLTSHMNSVHGKKRKDKLGIVTGRGAERRIQCPECDFKCKRWQAFNYHMVTHTGLKAYKCDECGKSFTQHSSLYSHKKTHSDKMYFTCQECGRQFKHKDVFVKHHRVHSTELNFKCHICHKALKTQKILDEHIKRHLKIKNYNCEVCGKCFVSKGELSTHMFTHNKSNDTFKCTVCPFTTSSSSNYKSHIQRHSGIRPHKCDQCDYAGCTLGELKSHLIKHSKESKFSCSICDMKFRHRNGIYKHMERKHGQLRTSSKAE